MSDLETSPSDAALTASQAKRGAPIWWPVLALLLALAALIGIGMAWQSLSRQQTLEQELVRRQAASQADASEARATARQAQELSRDTAAKVALLDARLAEVALQRGQLEDLIQSMSRSRDENVVVDIEASIQVALQQASITGSAEPLVATLKQADERLLRYKQPRMEGVRRAVARDLDRVKAVSVVDVSTLTIKLDEVVRLLDELPLMSAPVRAAESVIEKPLSRSPGKPGADGADGPAGPDGLVARWWWDIKTRWNAGTSLVWGETKSLVRVTRIDHPEGMLVTPEQTFFLRENLKLRLLNARLALLSRQFDTAQADLRDTQDMLARYFDTRARKVVVATDLLRQVAGQARQINVPRPDDTLAALAAAAAGR